jgi:hypothetical protein
MSIYIHIHLGCDFLQTEQNLVFDSHAASVVVFVLSLLLQGTPLSAGDRSQEGHLGAYPPVTVPTAVSEGQ